MLKQTLFIVVLVSLCGWACGSLIDHAQPESHSVDDSGPPNIMLIVGDEPAAVTAGLVTTMADHGVRFTRVSFVGPASKASVRSTLLTGFSPVALRLDRANGSKRETNPKDTLTATLPPEVRVFPELLRRAGYFTVRRGRALHNLSAGATEAAEELG